MEEVLVECKCSINGVSIKQRPRVVPNEARNQPTVWLSWKETEGSLYFGTDVYLAAHHFFLSWLMFYQSVHLDVDHLNSIYPLST